MLSSILTQLSPDLPWRDSIQCFDTVTSTNTLAKTLAAQGAPQGTVLIAGSQTGGRGRMGRSFYSPQDAGIYLSVILRPQCNASSLMHLTCAAAVAMCDALEKSTSLRPGIKWTNDLVHGRKKLGGILTELSLAADGSVDYAIIGIGINCSQQPEDFPEDIRHMAASLSMVTGQQIQKSQVAAAMITELYRMSGSLLNGKAAVMAQYRNDCITIGKEISLQTDSSTRSAVATGVDDQGALLVTFPDGHTQAVNSGEVSIRGMYGYI